jgi:hypothetical protein
LHNRFFEYGSVLLAALLVLSICFCAPAPCEPRPCPGVVPGNLERVGFF